MLLLFCTFAIKRRGLKILKLHFNNIHSLKGWHTIDFAAPPLSVAGLFAITGPTGAGKSTILDVITLALFNRMPRFDAKISSSEIEKAGSVMTHFTDTASAEVEYEAGNQRYRSTWSISRNRNGNLKDYEMTVAKLPENEFQTDKKSEVPAFNESVIGLNYDQFVRSILLSQGEFARFLKSDDKERASLLEKITGTVIYRKLGIAAYAKSQESKLGLEQKKQQIESIPVLTADEVRERTLGIRSSKQRMVEISGQLTEKIRLSVLLENREKLSRQIIAAEEQMTRLTKKLGEFEPEKQRLKKHQALDAYRGDLALYQNDTVRYRDILDEISEAKTKIIQLESGLGDSMKAMSALTGTEIGEENFLSEMKKFENEVNILDSQIRQLREHGQKVQQKYTDFLDSSKENPVIQNIKGLPFHSQLEFALGKQAALRSKYPNPRTQTEIWTLMESLREKHETLRKLATEAAQREENLALVADIKVRQHKLLEDLDSMQQMKANSSEELAACDKNVAQLRIEKENKLAVAGMEEHRSRLTAGSPCPLCGSTDHPYTEGHLLFDLGKAELELREAIKKQDLQKDILAKITESLASANAQKESLNHQLNEHQKTISRIEQAWQAGGSGMPDHKAVLLQSESIREEVKTLTVEYEDAVTSGLLDQCVLILSELTSLASEKSVAEKQRMDKYTGQDVSADANKIQNDYISARDLLKEYRAILHSKELDATAIKTSVESAGNRIAAPLKALGYGDISGALSDVLNDEEYKQLTKTREQLSTEQTQITTTLGNLRSELEKLQIPPDNATTLSALKDDIKQLENERDTLNKSLGALNTQLQKDKEMHVWKDREKKQLEEMTREATWWMHLGNLIGDATGNKYAKYAQNLSLRHLIQLANRRLRELNDRYILDVTDIEADLTIIDLYQGKTKRSVKTLSGGETFVVSLALALSLSDMASENVKLESLFIDEGFGTLDAEMLETAIETLEKLQSESGRTIGIISHVESLKERINTQIRVQKNGQGYSTLEIV